MSDNNDDLLEKNVLERGIEFYYKNPRQITVRQYEDLERWLEELGDLSGVIHDLNSNQIIGGNQRGRVFNINECEIQIDEEYDQPDPQGTIARGHVVWKGYKYTYRQVKWTEEQSEMANIIANKAGGEWDFDILANQFGFDDLKEWGFGDEELGFADPARDENIIEPECEIGVELLERHDYLVLYFDNEFDWKVACERFGVKTVEGAKVGDKSVTQRGLGRVVDGKKVLRLLNDE